MNVTAEKIKQIIEEINPYIDIQMDTNLFDEGIMDSLAIFALVMQIEDTYGVEVPDDAITKENFESIESIVVFVQKLLGE